MSSFDMISMAVRNLWKRKLRTFLTVLGVIIGTASIVVMVSIGIGMNEGYKAQIEQMGSLQVINVSAPNSNGGMMAMGPGMSSSSSKKKPGQVVLDLKAIDSFKAIPGVETATPVIQDYMRIGCGRFVNDVSIKGIDPASMEALGIKTSDGRLLQGGDTMTMVVGTYIKDNFYNPKLNWQMRYNSPPPVINIMEEKTVLSYDYSYGEKHQDKKIKPYKIKIVGILEGEGENSYTAFMPIKDLEKVVSDKEKYQKSQGNNGGGGNQKKKKGVYDTAMVKVADMNAVQDIQQQIKDMGYEAYSLSDYLKSMQETTKMLQIVLGAIGAISLFVAAIGITNTMVMSIYERTREIGVMKVIGASLSDIKRLFLTEAAFIGLMGGGLGMALSLIVSKIVNMVGLSQGQANNLSHIPLWLALAAMAFATFVGVAAGYFPAKRATKLSALSAIKTE